MCGNCFFASFIRMRYANEEQMDWMMRKKTLFKRGENKIQENEMENGWGKVEGIWKKIKNETEVKSSSSPPHLNMFPSNVQMNDAIDSTPSVSLRHLHSYDECVSGWASTRAPTTLHIHSLLLFFIAAKEEREPVLWFRLSRLWNIYILNGGRFCQPPNYSE